MSRRRSLSDEEEALWTGYARSITPLERARRPAEAVDETRQAQEQSVSRATEPSSARARPRPAPPPAAEKQPPPLAPLGRRLKQRVARGREAIDGRLDLHGKTQAQAHAALLRFLHRAQTDGARIVLVVTGKGKGGGADKRDAERGVLRRQVPHWLALPEFRTLVVGFEDAHVGHGGEGALYIRLRRGRSIGR